MMSEPKIRKLLEEEEAKEKVARRVLINSVGRFAMSVAEEKHHIILHRIELLKEILK